MRKQTAGEREKPDSALAFAGRIMYNLGCERSYRCGTILPRQINLRVCHCEPASQGGLSCRKGELCHCEPVCTLVWQFVFPVLSKSRKTPASSSRRYLSPGSYHTWREPEAGTFASAASGGRSEQKGVAAVEILRASASRRFRAPQQDITGGLEN